MEIALRSFQLKSIRFVQISQWTPFRTLLQNECDIVVDKANEHTQTISLFLSFRLSFNCKCFLGFLMNWANAHRLRVLIKFSLVFFWSAEPARIREWKHIRTHAETIHRRDSISRSSLKLNLQLCAAPLFFSIRMFSIERYCEMIYYCRVSVFEFQNPCNAINSKKKVLGIINSFNLFFSSSFWELNILMGNDLLVWLV